MNKLIKRISVIAGLRTIPSFCMILLSSIATNIYAETFKASSSKHPVALIELYTSQGCSSCPPADEWLGSLEKSGIENNQAVPLALHVDYWDYIGWKDQFSQKYFTKRQYQYRKTNHSSSVYTPQIIFNGYDVRRVTLNKSFDELRQMTAPVYFNVAAETVDEKRLKLAINFERIDTISKNSRVVVVLAENNLVGKIKSGENAGRTLIHNHVVRVWKNMGQIRNQIDIELPIDPTWKRDNLEVVVIVETADMQTQQTLQLALK